jgi:hypothetical protein
MNFELPRNTNFSMAPLQTNKLFVLKIKRSGAIKTCDERTCVQGVGFLFCLDTEVSPDHRFTVIGTVEPCYFEHQITASRRGSNTTMVPIARLMLYEYLFSDDNVDEMLLNSFSVEVCDQLTT